MCGMGQVFRDINLVGDFQPDTEGASGVVKFDATEVGVFTFENYIVGVYLDGTLVGWAYVSSRPAYTGFIQPSIIQPANISPPVK